MKMTHVASHKVLLSLRAVYAQIYFIWVSERSIETMLVSGKMLQTTSVCLSERVETAAVNSATLMHYG